MMTMMNDLSGSNRSGTDKGTEKGLDLLIRDRQKNTNLRDGMDG